MIAGTPISLDATNSIDSQSDRNTLTVVWDVDCSTDSDGDGIKDNDADLVGIKVNHTFPRAGIWEIKAIAWDEDVFNPASKTMKVEVDSPDRTAVEEVIASLSGDEANPFLQLLVVAIIVACVVMVMKRVR